MIAKADPNTKLDFSNAPDLEAIVMSYLEFKNDFSGNMVAQALRYHAKRGTQIRIILLWPSGSGTFVKAPDAKLLKSLTKSTEAWSKNIKMQKYLFWDKTPDLIRVTEFIERCYGMRRLSSTLSRTPGKSGVIVGGRNIKRHILFKRCSPIRRSRHGPLRAGRRALYLLRRPRGLRSIRASLRNR